MHLEFEILSAPFDDPVLWAYVLFAHGERPEREAVVIRVYRYLYGCAHGVTVHLFNIDDYDVSTVLRPLLYGEGLRAPARRPTINAVITCLLKFNDLPAQILHEGLA